MGKHGMMITNDNLLHILLLSFFNMYMLLITMTHKCCFLHPSINNTSYKWCIPWSITIPILFSPSSLPCYLNFKLNMSIKHWWTPLLGCKLHHQSYVMAQHIHDLMSYCR
jgi:hypothetical protein